MRSATVVESVSEYNTKQDFPAPDKIMFCVDTNFTPKSPVCKELCSVCVKATTKSMMFRSVAAKSMIRFLGHE